MAASERASGPDESLRELEPIPGLVSTVGRPVRVLCLHGGDSNANIMRFQTAPLRRALGSDAEWFFPEGLERGHPQAQIPASKVKLHGGASSGMTRSALEERLSNGRPFVSWYRYALDETNPNGWRYDQASLRRGVEALAEYVAAREPPDVVVTFSQGGLILAGLTHHIMEGGKQVPWRLNVVFNAANASGEHIPCPHVPLTQPTFFITSNADALSGEQIDTWSAFCTNISFILHDDGFCFPTTAPRATEIYAHLASEVQRHCGIGHAQAHASVAPASFAADVVSLVSVEDLAASLCSGECLLVDARDVATPFPGTELGVGVRALRMRSSVALARLGALREAGQTLVVVAPSEAESREYCALLLDDHGFVAGSLRRLIGGLEEVRAALAIKITLAGNAAAAAADGVGEAGEGGAAATAACAAAAPGRRVAPAELACMLLAGRCLIADVREPDESRRRRFPGAERGASLLTIRRRPMEASRWLRPMREDGRPVIAVSATGVRCGEYCARLVSDFGFEVGQVLQLDGGIHGWQDWAEDHKDLADHVRQNCGMLPVRGRQPQRGVEEAACAREHSLVILSQA